MLLAKRRNSRVVNTWPVDTTSRQQCAEGRPMVGGFGQHDKSGRCQPCVYLIECPCDRRRWRIDARMGHDSEELMQARPRNRPGCLPFGEFCHPLRSGFMKRRIFSMRIDQNVRVHGDQLPRPSYVRSRMLSHDALRSSGCKPRPLKLARRNLNGMPGFVSATTRRRPRSISVRSVTPSRAAILRASRSNGSDISTVVFMVAIHMELIIWVPI